MLIKINVTALLRRIQAAVIRLSRSPCAWVRTSTISLPPASYLPPVRVFIIIKINGPSEGAHAADAPSVHAPSVLNPIESRLSQRTYNLMFPKEHASVFMIEGVTWTRHVHLSSPTSLCIACGGDGRERLQVPVSGEFCTAWHTRFLCDTGRG